jgi:hypothetical protein
MREETVRPEVSKGPSQGFDTSARTEMREEGFDRLSPNGDA